MAHSHELTNVSLSMEGTGFALFQYFFGASVALPENRSTKMQSHIKLPISLQQHRPWSWRGTRETQSQVHLSVDHSLLSLGKRCKHRRQVP